MGSAPLFLGLTRPATFGGLPMSYVVFLIMIVMGGFFATLSFVYLLVSGVVSYAGLRLLAAKDLRLVDSWLVVLQHTPIRASQLAGRGVTYRA